MIKSIFCLLLIGAVAGCTGPEQASSNAYPQNAAISSLTGVPHDSATNYFREAVHLAPIPFKSRSGYDTARFYPKDWKLFCDSDAKSASENLFAFKAPVLSNYFLGHTIYRFTWLRSFDRPVVLTLHCAAKGGTLTTQILSKELNLGPMQMPDPNEPSLTPAEKVHHTELREAMMQSESWMAQYARSQKPLTVLNQQTVTVTQGQLQEFTRLLYEARFWELPSCQPMWVNDGADWTLETHEPTRYASVVRQSPSRAPDRPFRQCCEYLLNLSPARSEERY